METQTALENLADVVIEVTTWAESALNFIVSNPILLIGVAIFAVGAGIGLVKRVLR